MAEAIFLHKLAERGLSSNFVVDSAGTGNWHEGETPDPRTIRTLSDHGMQWASHARQFHTNDFAESDLILAMDSSNVADLERWPGAQPEKVRLMLDCIPDSNRREVPDPYSGGLAGFENVFQMLNESCECLLNEILQQER